MNVGLLLLTPLVEGILVSRVSCYVCRVCVATLALSELKDNHSQFAVLSRKCERFCDTSIHIA